MRTLNYKGQLGSIEASTEDNCLYGQLLFIKPLINYEAETVKELEQVFKDAVEGYISTCTAKDILPEQPCKGSLNVRLGHELHLKAAIAAKEENVSLNEWLKINVLHAVG